MWWSQVRLLPAAPLLKLYTVCCMQYTAYRLRQKNRATKSSHTIKNQLIISHMKHLIQLLLFLFILNPSAHANEQEYWVKMQGRDSVVIAEFLTGIAQVENRISPDEKNTRYERFLWQTRNQAITISCSLRHVTFDGEEEMANADCLFGFKMAKILSTENIVVQNNGIINATFADRALATKMHRKIREYGEIFDSWEQIPSLDTTRLKITCATPNKNRKIAHSCSIQVVQNNIPGVMPEEEYEEEDEQK